VRYLLAGETAMAVDLAGLLRRVLVLFIVADCNGRLFDFMTCDPWPQGLLKAQAAGETAMAVDLVVLLRQFVGC
jgi:hypothetical protein